MSQVMTGADGPLADWRDEEWVRIAGNLSLPERMRRITAVSVLLSGTDDISDGLYSELVVLIEALQGEDLKYADTYTHQETAIKYLDEFRLSISALAHELETIARGIAEWPQEIGDQA